ncbi:hypothetical protein SAMN05421736_109143 [Evansella caseinilytica]|uniref:Uncharacterized protein n=1 Tax=Evansella caseinilytica TaxID=1503961 RepID=A0A1H3S1I3_9BACI|nr:hypothetical protein [Evansella caseinilytica]SDZ31029.1 hypothetical protein SAMN05421736_109143 [Evansella caseinilytica]
MIVGTFLYLFVLILIGSAVLLVTFFIQYIWYKINFLYIYSALLFPFMIYGMIKQEYFILFYSLIFLFLCILSSLVARKVRKSSFVN